MHNPARQDWCKKLSYRGDREWLSLPDWAQSLIEIGWAIGTLPKTENRVFVSLLLPHRGFAAAFIALGHVLSQAIPLPTEADLDRHFADLLDLAEPLKPKTSLIYLLEGRALQGVFDGIHRENGVPLVAVRVQRDFAYRTSGAKYFVDRSKAAYLHINPDGDGQLRKHISSRATVKNAAFLDGLYTPGEANLIHIASVPSVTVVGRLSTARAEVCEERFARKVESEKISEGFLNEVLKIDRFVSASTRPRVRLIAAAGEGSIVTDEIKNSSLVVLDGADTYLKWDHHFTQSNIVTLLCQTDTQIADAIENINARSLYRDQTDERIQAQTLPMPCAGTDGTVFWEKRR